LILLSSFITYHGCAEGEILWMIVKGVPSYMRGLYLRSRCRARRACGLVAAHRLCPFGRSALSAA